MALVTKTQAAQLVGISRPTFYRHISKGKVSVVDNKDGTQSIDTAELLRVYHELKPITDETDATKTDAHLQSVIPLNVSSDVNIELMEYKIEELTKRLAESEARNKDERSEKAKLLSVIEGQSLALENKNQPSFLERLFKRS